MQTFTTIIALLSATAGLVSAAPATRQFQAQVHFLGANPPDAEFDMSVPTDASIFAITNPLSITAISLEGGASCTFFGIDGSSTIVVGHSTEPVGPPQTQVSGTCLAL